MEAEEDDEKKKKEVRESLNSSYCCNLAMYSYGKSHCRNVMLSIK